MTAKQKAKQLFDKIQYDISGCCITDLAALHATKYAARIAVDEAISVLDDFEYSEHGKCSGSYGQDYWQRVKAEIEKL